MRTFSNPEKVQYDQSLSDVIASLSHVDYMLFIFIPCFDLLYRICFRTHRHHRMKLHGELLLNVLECLFTQIKNYHCLQLQHITIPSSRYYTDYHVKDISIK